MSDTHSRNAPTVIIMAGPNGAGKSTTASAILSQEGAEVENYINPDLIARGLSPNNPDSVSFHSGRIVHDRIRELMRNGENFAFETTLSGRTYIRTIQMLKGEGYTVKLFFLWLKSPDLALIRVRERVKSGGHNIPEDTIIRRYTAGLRNFFNLYQDMVDEWRLYNSSKDAGPQLIASASGGSLTIKNTELWARLNSKYKVITNGEVQE